MYKLEEIPAITGKRLTCGCGYSWVYLGTRKYIASCPRCHSSVTIESKRKNTQESIIDQRKNHRKENQIPQTARTKVGHPREPAVVEETKPPARWFEHMASSNSQPNKFSDVDKHQTIILPVTTDHCLCSCDKCAGWYYTDTIEGRFVLKCFCSCEHTHSKRQERRCC